MTTKPKSTEAEPEDQVKTSIFTAGVLRKVKDFLEEEMYCDVTLVSNPDNFKIKAHKLILSAASEYFHKMFCTPFKESNENYAELHVDGESLKSVTGYIYTASIELTADTVEDVLRAASLFQIATLVTICSDFMAKQLDSTNCLGINLFAEQYNLEELSKLSEDFVCEHFMEILEGEEFFMLDVGQLSRILSNDNLRLFSEEDVFRSLKSWVDHDRPEREKHMQKLLHQVRFQLLSPEYILTEILETIENKECRELILESFIWHSLPESCRLKYYAEKQTTRRTRTDMLLAITGWSGNDSTLKVGFLHSKSSGWIYKSWPGLPVGLSKFASVCFEDKLIIAGGVLKDTQEVTNSVHCLDLKTLKWTSLAPLSTPGHSFKMAAIDGFIYTLGGMDEDEEWIGTIDKWCSLRNQWTRLNSLRKVPYNFRTNLNSFHIFAPASEFYVYIRVDDSPSPWSVFLCSPIGFVDDKSIYAELLQNSILGVFKMCDETYLHISREIASTLVFEEEEWKLVSEFVFDKPISKECHKISFIDGRIIAYGSNVFEQYDHDPVVNEWVRKPMPQFKNDDEDEVVVVSIS